MPLAESDLDEIELSEPVPADPNAEVEVAPAKPTPSEETLTAVRELAEVVRETSKPKEEPTKPPTQEELNSFWKVYDPEQSDKEFYNKWFRLNPDATSEEKAQAKELFGAFKSGMMTEVHTAIGHYIKRELSKFEKERVAPIQSYVSASQVRETRDRFTTTYPGLKDKSYEKVLRAVANDLNSSQQTFPSEEAYFKALAEGAADVIKGVKPDFNLGTKTKPSAGNTPRLPRGRVGGTGGTGGGTEIRTPGDSSRNDVDELGLDD